MGDFKWYDRVRLQFRIKWDVLPDTGLPPKKWLFDCTYGFQGRGQKVLRSDYSMRLGIGWFSSVDWLRFSIRLMGLDVGFGFIYRDINDWMHVQ